jgi:uncharacterized protein (DUF1501 family)
MTITRRGFLAGTAAVAAGIGRTEIALAAPDDVGHSLVVVNLDGGLDGLSAVVPAGESAYYDRRRTVAVPGNRTLALDGRFGLHPALAPLHPLWQDGMLAIVPAVGSLGGSRSHFAEQALLSRGVGPGDAEPSGWITRHLRSRPGSRPVSLRGVGISNHPSLMLAADEHALTIADLAAAEPRLAEGDDLQRVASALTSAYGSSTPAMTWAAAAGAEALRRLREADASAIPPHGGAVYPDDPWAQSLRQVAQLLHAGLGVEAGVVTFTGWDTHQAMGGWATGQLSQLLTRLGAALGAFAADVSDMLDRLTIVVVSEFGRRLVENSSGGTDHGHGGVALVVGRGVQGGVHGAWPGLEEGALDRGDVAAATDIRSVLGGVVARRLGNPNVGAVFPGWSGELVAI